MNYNIIELDNLYLTGFMTKMQGDFSQRIEQQTEFMQSNIDKYELLFKNSINKDFKLSYNVLGDIKNNEFNFYTAFDCNGKKFDEFQLIIIPKRKYLIFTTNATKKPVKELIELIKTINLQWLIENNFEFDNNAYILEKYYWFLPTSSLREKRYIEYYIPIK